MPVTTQVFKATFVSTGTTGPYPFAFPISDVTAMTVTVNGVLLNPATYTVDPVNNNFENGGSVTLSTLAPSGQTVVLLRQTPLTQLDVFTDNMPVPLKTIELALDKLTEIDQEIAGVLDIPQAANTIFAGPPNGSPAPPSFRQLVPADVPGGGGGGSGVTSLNSLTGIVNIAVGAGLNINTTGSTITISLATTFAINSFTGGSTVEVGASVTNPAFTATYSTPPANANITNTEGIDSPLTLTTPFTLGTVVGTFVHTAPETTTFTLSATQGTTLTATQTINWEWAIFGGIGTAGATSTVTASGTTAVLSTSDVLARVQLGNETVGELLGPFSPSGQVIYLLLTGSAHTFIDANTGFPIPFNSPTTVAFVNVHGSTVTLYLYQTTNALYGTVNPKVAS